MVFRLIDSGWGSELVEAARHGTTALKIVCPFIKLQALKRLLQGKHQKIQVITRFNLAGFACGVSDVVALRLLLTGGAQVRGICNLHTKLYLFGDSRAICTSANLTSAALDRNHEFGFVSDEQSIVTSCRRYFDDLWPKAGTDLTMDSVDEWDGIVRTHFASGALPDQHRHLPDFGVDVGLGADPAIQSAFVANASQAFVKFLGSAKNRTRLSFPVIDEIKRTGCHWAVGYPAKKRPRNVREGDVIFIARLTIDPNDIRIFGRAIGMEHIPGRDDATPREIADRPWKAEWPCYIRVHDAEFIAGNVGNGVSLNALMEELGSNSFASTQKNAANLNGNTNPRQSYVQQPAVKLSQDGFEWLNEHLEAAFVSHGKIPTAEIAKLDWPDRQ